MFNKFKNAAIIKEINSFLNTYTCGNLHKANDKIVKKTTPTPLRYASYQ